jgi:hypothetical protein
MASSPIWGSWPDIYYSLTVTVLFLWDTLSDRGPVSVLYMLLVLVSVVCLGSESLGTRDNILLSQIWDSFFFVAFCYSQGHGGGIRPCLHTGMSEYSSNCLSYIVGGTDHAAQKTQPLYCCRSVLPRSCLANNLGADHIQNSFHSWRVFVIAGCLFVRYAGRGVLLLRA